MPNFSIPRKPYVFRRYVKTQDTISTTFRRVDSILSGFTALSSEQKESVIEEYYIYFYSSLQRAQTIFAEDYTGRRYISECDALISELYFFGYITTVLYIEYTNTIDKMIAHMEPAMMLFREVEANGFLRSLNSLLTSDRNKYHHKFIVKANKEYKTPEKKREKVREYQSRKRKSNQE